MSSNSFLDTFLNSLSMIYQTLLASYIGNWLPGLLIQMVVLWFSAVGWNRHRQLGFLFFLISAALGIAAGVLYAVAFSKLSGSGALPGSAFTGATCLHYLAIAFQLCALWHLVFRANFAPPTKPEVYQP